MKTFPIFPHVKTLNIWDLDGTVINSFKRVSPCLDEAGNLDLVKYVTEACHHDKIMCDTLLPLVSVMLAAQERGDHNVIVTARRMSNSDYYFLRKQGLRGRGDKSIQAFSRDTLARYFPLDQVKERYYSRDAEYKRGYFEILRAQYPNAVITVYDDHKGVLAVAREMGFNAVDAVLINDALEIGMKLIGEQLIDETLCDDLDLDYLKAKIEFAWDCMTDEEKAEYTGQTHLLNRVA